MPRPARFAGGQFDCVGVFAPFTLQALERPGSHVVFSSKDFPGTIPDHIVVAADAGREDRPTTSRSSSTPGTRRSTTSTANPRGEHRRSWPTKAELSPADYEELAERHEALHRRRGARGVPARRPTSTSLQYTARQINPFLVESGLTQEEGVAQGPVRAASSPQAYADRSRLRSVTTRTRLEPRGRHRSGSRWDARRGGRGPSCPGPVARRTPGKGTRAPPGGAAAAPRRDPALGARVARVRRRRRPVRALVGRGDVLVTNTVLVPTPSAAWNAGVDYWNSGELGTDFVASATRVLKGYSISMGIGIVLGLADRQLPIGRGVLGVARSGSCATSPPPRSRRCSCCGSASTSARRSRSSSWAPCSTTS